MTVIYALVDELGIPRYVGQTMKLLGTRLSQHRSAASRGSRPLDLWLRGCLGVSIIPLEVDPDDADASERKWIRQMRAGGVDLVNLSDGGRRAPSGVRHTEDARRRIGDARRGKTLSLDHRAKLASAHQGIPLGDEHRAAIGRGGRGLIRSAESRSRLSAAKMGDLNPMSAARRAAREGVDLS